MSEWDEVTLGDVLTLQRGFDLPASERRDGPFPVVSSAGVSGTHDQAKVDGPGVVIGRTGTLGRVHWLDTAFWPHNTSLWVRDFKGNNERFVAYLLETITMDGSTMAAVPGVNRNHLHPLAVRRPDLLSQRRIAAALSAFDNLINLNKRRIALLEELARSLYHEWFVRMRFPGHDRVEMVKSDVGEIPSSWSTATLGSTAKWYSGGTPSTKNEAYWGGPVPWITSGSLTSFLLHDAPKTLTEDGVRAGSRAVDRDAVLFVVRGMSLAREFRVGIAERRLAFGQDCKALVAHEPLAPLYLAFTLFARRDQIQRMVEFAAHGTGKLSTDRLKAIEYPLPPRELQDSFVGVVEPLREQIAQLVTAQGALAWTRDLLLPRLVTGRLDIEDIDLGELLTEPRGSGVPAA